MTDLIDTTEMYLRTILELEEEGIVPLRARIAERLDHSGPTVSQTVARMERDGLVHVRNDRHLELTADGREKAVSVMRKHRLAERLLADVIGLDWAYVHEEACRWEHVMSEQVELRLLDLLHNPAESPYGNPIPGLGDLRPPVPGTGSAFDRGERLSVVSGQPGRYTVVRLTEAIQTDPDLLSELALAGVRPGQSIEIAASDGYVTVRAAEPFAFAQGGVALEVNAETASHIIVER
ncbi:iron dependent repressor, metal binding and dimerization domain protein [Citricoccus nitrophenolicus]|uniref:Iron dependent repressor, metal binding and dimerization domain protein n=1 Tax=Citricoccus nitrophenolicus TaxID=863575 RepID=A0ABV0IM33_9MICC